MFEKRLSKNVEMLFLNSSFYVIVWINLLYCIVLFILCFEHAGGKFRSFNDLR